MERAKVTGKHEENHVEIKNKYGQVRNDNQSDLGNIGKSLEILLLLFLIQFLHVVIIGDT